MTCKHIEDFKKYLNTTTIEIDSEDTHGAIFIRCKHCKEYDYY